MKSIVELQPPPSSPRIPDDVRARIVAGLAAALAAAWLRERETADRASAHA
jgi:hypothetical protein